MDALSEDERYLEDMEGLFHKSGRLEAWEPVQQGQYDLALVGCSLGRCANLRAVLHAAAAGLKTGGLLLTQYENYYSLSNLNAALEERLPEEGVFLHDPEDRLSLRVIVESALTAALQQEGMALEKSVSLTNDSWGSKAGRVLSALGIQETEGGRRVLLSLGKFSVWRKKT